MSFSINTRNNVIAVINRSEETTETIRYVLGFFFLYALR